MILFLLLSSSSVKNIINIILKLAGKDQSMCILTVIILFFYSFKVFESSSNKNVLKKSFFCCFKLIFQLLFLRYPSKLTLRGKSICLATKLLIDSLNFQSRARDSTPRFVRRFVSRSVGWSLFTFFIRFIPTK